MDRRETIEFAFIIVVQLAWLGQGMYRGTGHSFDWELYRTYMIGALFILLLMRLVYPKPKEQTTTLLNR